MVEQRSYTGSLFDNRWKFTGKELDTDTGLYYFGARYYNPSTSIWLSVDPLAEKYPAYSPYNYCINNPINVIDPNGRDIVIIGSPEFRKRVWGELKSLMKNSKTGAFLVQQALKSKNNLVIFETAYKSQHGEVDNWNSSNSYETLGVDLEQLNGVYSTEDGHNGESLEYNARTFFAHEISHFLSPEDGNLILNGYDVFGADEVNAVEWENMVRKELKMKERTHYAGVKVSGKKLKKNKDGFYKMVNNKEYGNKNLIDTGNKIKLQHKTTNDLKKPRTDKGYRKNFGGIKLKMPQNSQSQRLAI